MRGTTHTIKDNKVTVLSKGVTFKYEHQFFLDIQALWEDGYRFIENPTRNEASLRNFRGCMGRAVLVKDAGSQAVVPEVVEEVVATPEEKPVEVAVVAADEGSVADDTQGAGNTKVAENADAAVTEGVKEEAEVVETKPKPKAKAKQAAKRTAKKS